MNEFDQIESSQKQYINQHEHEVRMEFLEIEQQYKRFSMLKPTVYKDGDKWCVGYGEMPNGVFGFGDTPHEAVLDWDIQWSTK